MPVGVVCVFTVGAMASALVLGARLSYWVWRELFFIVIRFKSVGYALGHTANWKAKE